jgi:hypothetical protein
MSPRELYPVSCPEAYGAVLQAMNVRVGELVTLARWWWRVDSLGLAVVKREQAFPVVLAPQV